MSFEDILNEAIHRRDIWNLSSYSWSSFGYILIVTGTLSGLSITAFTDSLGIKTTRIIGFVSAACTALVASLHPIDTGDNFREAWRILDQAILEYKSTDKTKEDVTKLLKSIHDGEEFLRQANIKIAIPSGNGTDTTTPPQPDTSTNHPGHN